MTAEEELGARSKNRRFTWSTEEEYLHGQDVMKQDGNVQVDVETQQVMSRSTYSVVKSN